MKVGSCHLSASKYISRPLHLKYCQNTSSIQKTNMKKVVAVLVALVAVAAAAPQRSPEADAQVLRFDLDNIGVDGYSYAYETSNRIQAQEQGQLINAGTDNEAIAVRGSYQYVGPDGQTYQVTYIADENGFQPQGAHLPH
ncbi:flexible cuticle protein 12-like [Aethina tumida]|uniref:flexible cuticle protein 12-like n=1 Tax=Aethina tumida TaxID=116153 RepID=UPI0021479692|nr:flexible cuticle protein 12-like [Aethina tumida]